MNLQPRITTYLRWDRYSAMADFIMRRAGTMEVPISYDPVTARELPPIKWSCCDWPERVVVE
jgi:hypothetical protein